jgi:hypothetical protein
MFGRVITAWGNVLAWVGVLPASVMAVCQSERIYHKSTSTDCSKVLQTLGSEQLESQREYDS